MNYDFLINILIINQKSMSTTTPRIKLLKRALYRLSYLYMLSIEYIYYFTLKNSTLVGLLSIKS